MYNYNYTNLLNQTLYTLYNIDKQYIFAEINEFYEIYEMINFDHFNQLIDSYLI